MDKEKITEEVKASSYLQSLPPVWHDFTLTAPFEVVDDAFYLYRYNNEALHCGLTIYYHDETKEYKLSVKLGKTEFGRMECIEANLSAYEKQLQAYLEKILLELKAYDPTTISSLLWQTGLEHWQYKDIVPDELEGFQLFINPSQPRRITNGSYILIDYENFTTSTNFVIYYNIFRDEFFSETHIKGDTELNYDFDAKTIDQLTDNLRKYMQPYLADVAQRADRSKHA